MQKIKRGCGDENKLEHAIGNQKVAHSLEHLGKRKAIVMKNLDEVVGEMVKSIINGDKDHGWGQKDSMTVVEAIVNQDVENYMETKKDPMKYTLSEEALALINDFMNPSAARQKLESAKLLNKGAKQERTKAMWAELAK